MGTTGFVVSSCMGTGRYLTPLMLCFAAVFALAGCVTTPPSDTAEWPEPPDPKLVLQAGDELQITFLYWSELDSEQRVRIDGKISLQLIGELEVVGMTPGQLRAQLIEMYDPHLKDPEINVVASTLGTRRVFVGGEVLNPGVVLMGSRNITVIEAIMQAGGPNKRSAKMANVVVVRQHEGKQYARSVNLRDMVENATSQPFHLAPFDVVYVPRTNIDKLGQWVDQYINAIVPRNFYANYTWMDQRDAIVDTETSSVNVNMPGI